MPERDKTPHVFLETVYFQEFALERAMQNMLEVWDTVSFHYHPYRDTGVSILSSVDEIQTMLDDQIVKTQTMRGSPFIKPFETEIKVRLRKSFCSPIKNKKKTSNQLLEN